MNKLSLVEKIEDIGLNNLFARMGTGLNIGSWSRLGMYISKEAVSKVIGYDSGYYLPFTEPNAKPIVFGVSTTDNPMILVDDMASFCTQIIAFDRKGNVVSFHYPLVSFSFDYMVEKHLNDFKTKMYDTLGDEKLIAVTSTNISNSFYTSISPQITGRERVKREGLFLSLQEFFSGENIQFVIANQSSNDLIYTPLPKETCGFSGIPYISGYCFVPKQLSQSNRNEYFILFQNNVIKNMKKYGGF
jgi:hypothetical protein